MAMTGPQKIPGANQSNFYGTGQYSGSAMEVNCGVVHTTEGRTLPGYNNGALAPTVTGVPDIAAKKIRWYQHYDVDESARALANKLGGVQTNTSNAFQIELVGTCDDSKKATWSGKQAGVDYLHWPSAPDWALTEVAWLVRWLHDYHNVPLTCVKDWLAYGKDSRRPGVTPASYGASPARMTFTQWNAFTGWCGHQHVPENDHGDPGNLDFARVIQLAKGDTSIPEVDVAFTADDKKWLEDAIKRLVPAAVLTTDGIVKNINPATSTGNPFSAAATALNNIESVTRRTEGKVDALPAVELTDMQIASLASAVAGNAALAELIAEKVAVKLAERLAE